MTVPFDLTLYAAASIKLLKSPADLVEREIQQLVYYNDETQVRAKVRYAQLAREHEREREAQLALEHELNDHERTTAMRGVIIPRFEREHTPPRRAR